MHPIITDGVSTIYPENTIPNAQALHRNGVRVICIGIGDNISIAEIRAISSPPHEKDVDYFIRKSFGFPESFVITLVENIKQRQVETTTQSNSPSDENKSEYNGVMLTPW